MRVNPRDPADLLWRYLKKHKLTQAAFAKRTGITEAQVSRLLGRSRGPSNTTAHAIEAATRGEVPAKAWIRPRQLPKAA